MYNHTKQLELEEAKYEGERLNGKKHGHGVYHEDGVEHYEGEFLDGRVHEGQ